MMKTVLSIILVQMVFVTGGIQALASPISIMSEAHLDGRALEYPFGEPYTDLITNENRIDLYKTTGEFRGLIEFDLSSVPPGLTVASATLTLEASRFGAAGAVTVQVYSYIGDGILSASDADVLGGLEGAFTRTDPGTSVSSISISPALVQAAINSTGYVGFQLSPGFTGGQVFGFTSREGYDVSPTVRTAPTLTIEVVPEPATLGLLTLGTLALLRRRNRRD